MNFLKIILCLLLLTQSSAVLAQATSSGSINTPSGYSIDLQTGNLLNYDSSLKTNNGWNVSGMPGSFVTDGYTFSYSNSTVSQTVNAGNFPVNYQNTSAIFVTGISYGFQYRFPCANKIGGYCEDVSGMQDNLSATFEYFNKSGAIEHSQLHQLGLKNINDGNPPYNPTWQSLAETYTFSGAKMLSTVGTAKLSITGMDTGFWACSGNQCYGPQVKDAYMHVNYSVDPCILNPAFSSGCPGFSSVVQGSLSPTFWWNYDIAKTLPHIGGGVQLHGFDYGFGYYAGDYCTASFIICWASSGANGRNVSFNINDKFGTSLYNDSWWVEGNYSGGSRSGRVLFVESQNSLNMGRISWNVWGGYGDNMGIAPYTKPIWSPDPCYTQPLYSPNCSNFNAEIKRLADEQNKIQQTSLNEIITASTPPPAGKIPAPLEDPESTNPKIKVAIIDSDSGKPPLGSPPLPGSAPPPGAPSPVTSLTMSVSESTGKSISRLDNPAQSDSTALALSIIKQNQQRENNIALQASQTAVENAQISAVAGIKQAETLALDLAQKSSSDISSQKSSGSTESIAGTNKSETFIVGPAPGSTSIVFNKSDSSATVNNQQNTQNSAEVLGMVSLKPITSVAQTEQTSTNTSVVIVNPVQIFNTSNQTIQQNTGSVQTFVNINVSTAPIIEERRSETGTASPLLPPTSSAVAATQTQTSSQYTPPMMQLSDKQEQLQSENIVTNAGAIQINLVQPPQIQSAEVQPVTTQTVAIAPVTQLEIPQTAGNFLIDRTNPINNILDTKPTTPEPERQTNTQYTTKQNIQDNDAAAGVSIDNLARAPVGFNTYLVALSDVNFYAPKEIYRNQRTVDNVRALRQLSSDRLHQEMVDQQYRR